MKKPLERLAFAVAALLVLLIAVIFVMGSVTKQRRDAAVAEFRERLPATYTQTKLTGSGAEPDLAANSAPTEEATNATDRIEAFERLFEAYDKVRESEAWKACEGLPCTGFPPQWVPSEWSPEEWDLARAFVEANADLLAWVRREAELGGPIWEADLSRGWSLGIRNILLARRLARMLSLAALVHGQNGQTTAALENIVAMMHLSDAITGSPTVLTAHEVGSDINGFAFETIRHVLPPGSLNGEQTHTLLELTAQEGGRQAFVKSLLGEGEALLGGFNDIRSSDEPIPALLSSVGGPWLNMAEIAIVDIVEELAEAAAQPHYEAAPTLQRIRRDLEELPRTRMLMRSFVAPELAVVIHIVETQARHEAQLDLMRIGLLVELHQTQHGSLPESLDVIAPNLGGSLPIDPFTGEPYRYVVQDDTFRLYSVGPNGADDGGQADYQTGDIVWRGEH